MWYPRNCTSHTGYLKHVYYAWKVLEKDRTKLTLLNAPSETCTWEWKRFRKNWSQLWQTDLRNSKYYELVEKQLNKKLGNIYNIYKLFSLIMLVLPFEAGTMFVLPFETRTLFSFHVDYRMSLEKARRSLLKLMKLERASQYIVNW